MASTEVARGGVDRKQWMAPPKGSPADRILDALGQMRKENWERACRWCPGWDVAGTRRLAEQAARGGDPRLSWYVPVLEAQDRLSAKKSSRASDEGCRMWAGGVGRAQTRAGGHIGSRRTGGAPGCRSRASSDCLTRAGATSRCGWRSATRSAKRCRGHFEDATKRDKVDEQIDRGCPWQASGDRRAWRRRRWLNSSLVETGSLNRGQARHFLATPTTISQREDTTGETKCRSSD